MKIETKYRRVRAGIGRIPNIIGMATVIRLYVLAARAQADDLRRHPPAAR